MPNAEYACPSCGADNRPEHCMDGSLIDGEDSFSGVRCEPGAVCVCDCADCNPQTCRECGDDLHGG